MIPTILIKLKNVDTYKIFVCVFRATASLMDGYLPAYEKKSKQLSILILKKFSKPIGKRASKWICR